jgi:hypothetical protein
MKNKNILVGASIRGDSHEYINTKCQDAFSAKISDNGEWQSITVCDGAGSSVKSDQSARLFADNFTASLLLLAQEIENKKFGNWITDFILNQIIQIRQNMRQQFGSDNLDEFHTTLVSLLLGPPEKIGGRAGISIHIGDGAIVGANFSVERQTIFINQDYKIISAPENGEYSNETYFVTENRWIKHIRISPVEDRDWFILGTDGGFSAIFKPNLTPHEELLDIFESFRVGTEKNRKQSLENILTDQKIKYRTDDDKTLVVLVPEILMNDDEIKFPFSLIETSLNKIQEADAQKINISENNKIVNQKDSKEKRNIISSKNKVINISNRKIFIGLFVILIGFISIMILNYEKITREYNAYVDLIRIENEDGRNKNNQNKNNPTERNW